MAWFEMWYKDKESIIACMIRNMQDDLNAGYDPRGKSITEQRQTLHEYEEHFKEQCDKLALMTEAQCNRWCYIDMKRRGVI